MRPSGIVHSFVQIDLLPASAPDHARAGGREDGELNGKPCDFATASRPKFTDELGNIGIREGAIMILKLRLCRQAFGDAINGVVTRAMASGLGPVHDDANSLSDLPGRSRLIAPDRLEDGQHITGLDLVNRLRSDAREDVGLQA